MRSLARTCICLCVAGASLWWAAGSVPGADDIQAALEVEAMTEGGSAGRSAVEAARAEVAAALAEAARRGQRPRASELVAALQESQRALKRAEAEVERLRGLVKRMAAQNRKERIAMHYNMGCVYRAGRRYRHAEGEFLKALALNADDADIHYNLAILYDDDLDDPARARTHYERFLELRPAGKDAAQVRQWLTALE